MSAEFINVSAVKKLVKANDRQCSPDFLDALDASVSAAIRRACTVHNGGAKRLDETVLTAGTVQESKKSESPSPESNYSARLAEIKKEIVCLELKANVITKAEYLKSIRLIKSLCDNG